MIATDYIFGRKKAQVFAGPNTFLGNVAGYIDSPELLAGIFRTLSGDSYPVENITNFSIVDNDVEATVTEDYKILNSAFHIPDNIPITFYKDIGGKCKHIMNAAFNSTPIHTAIFPNTEVLEDNVFIGAESLSLVYTPVVLTASSSAFSGIINASGEGQKYCAISPNISASIFEDRYWNVTVWDTNERSMLEDISAPYNLTVPIKYSEAVKIEYSHLIKQEIKEIEIFVNDIFHKKYSVQSEIFIDGFTVGISKNVKIRAINFYGETSSFSTTISVNSEAYNNPSALYNKSFYDPSEVHCYYSFEGTAKDRTGVYDATLVEEKYSYKEGFPVFKLTGLGYFELPDAAGYNGTQTILFRARKSVAQDMNIYSKGADSDGGWGILATIISDAFKVRTVTMSPTSGATHTSSSVSLPVDELHHFAYVYDNANDTHKLYIDGVLVYTLVKSGSGFRGNKRVYIGVDRTKHAFVDFAKGFVADFAIIKRGLTDAEITEAAEI